MSPQLHRALFSDLGRFEYQAAWDLQQALQAELIEHHSPEYLLFVEHPPTITIGRRGTADEVVAPRKVLEARGITVTQTDRGGQVTYHGPGQIVAYPILDLQAHSLGLHDYMRLLEESVIRTIAEYGVKGYRVEGRTGVWVGKEKICAMGIRVRRWCTIHGLALNVDTDLNHFGMIIPCGIRDRGVTSLKVLLGDAAPSNDAVRVRLRHHLAEQFGLELEETTPAALLARSSASAGN
jgi:lipoyl(octanoyl) transferase